MFNKTGNDNLDRFAVHRGLLFATGGPGLLAASADGGNWHMVLGVPHHGFPRLRLDLGLRQLHFFRRLEDLGGARVHEQEENQNRKNVHQRGERHPSHLQPVPRHTFDSS